MLVAQRVGPASPFKRKRRYGASIFNSAVSSAFPSGKRLDQAGVLAVLKRGKRLNGVDFVLRLLISPTKNVAEDSGIAISVPKRLLKSSVARNRIKRLVREAFRQHRSAARALHLLVNYKARNDGRDAAARCLLRTELTSLFDDAILRAQAGYIGTRAG